MNTTDHAWAVVLAAGEGKRLGALTTDRSGNAVPKQYCALDQGTTLLEDAFYRAAAVATLPQICTVVAKEHRQWWRKLCAPLGERNVIVQPANRGTGIGILLGLLSILQRDPDATIVFMPADHVVSNEAVMAEALQRLIQVCDEQALVLLGISPDEPDPELGYIVQGRRCEDGRYRVQRFVEKPDAWLAKLLVGNGCMWNSFIFAANGAALLRLFTALYPDIVEKMRAATGSITRTRDTAALDALYAGLGTIDFSRDILQRSERDLHVIAAPRCGWSDIGTPRSLYRCLNRQRRRPPMPVREPLLGLPPQLSLSQVFAALKWS